MDRRPRVWFRALCGVVGATLTLIVAQQGSSAPLLPILASGLLAGLLVRGFRGLVAFWLAGLGGAAGAALVLTALVGDALGFALFGAVDALLIFGSAAYLIGWSVVLLGTAGRHGRSLEPDDRQLLTGAVVAFVGQLVTLLLPASWFIPVGPLLVTGIVAGLVSRGRPGVRGVLAGGAIGAAVGVGLVAVFASAEDWALALVILEALVPTALAGSYLVTRAVVSGLTHFDVPTRA